MPGRKKTSPETEYSFGQVIKKYREQHGVSQVDLAKELHVSNNTVYTWESDRSKPDVDMIRRLHKMFQIPIQQLFNIYDSSEQLTRNERDLLSSFRSMTGRTQSLALSLISRMAEQDARLEQEELRRSYRVIGLEPTCAAAGQGDGYSQITNASMRFIKNNAINQRANRMVMVSGPSMEPVYYDGDVLYVEDTVEAYEGEDVIARIPDGLVVKRIGKNSQLYSVNPKYPFGPRPENEPLEILGRVIGVVDHEDIASGELASFLNNLMEDEVNEFYGKNGGEEAWL